MDILSWSTDVKRFILKNIFYLLNDLAFTDRCQALRKLILPVRASFFPGRFWNKVLLVLDPELLQNLFDLLPVGSEPRFIELIWSEILYNESSKKTLCRIQCSLMLMIKSFTITFHFFYIGSTYQMFLAHVTVEDSFVSKILEIL